MQSVINKINPIAILFCLKFKKKNMNKYWLIYILNSIVIYKLHKF